VTNDNTDLSPAEALFVELLGRVESCGDLDVNAFFAQHVEHAAELRELWSRHTAARGLQAHGLPEDPATLAADSLTRALIERLRGRSRDSARYGELSEIDRGGMGAIMRVWDPDVRQALAMKVILDASEERSVDGRKLAKFLEEAQITGQLDHLGIVPVHEIGLGADGRVYFTMRLIKGIDLRRVFELVRTGEDGWNTTRALGVLLKACEAMSYAHSKRVIHRDLKPGNVMVGKFGEVCVMDWGLARVLGREDVHDLRNTLPANSARACRRQVWLSAPHAALSSERGLSQQLRTLT